MNKITLARMYLALAALALFFVWGFAKSAAAELKIAQHKQEQKIEAILMASE